MIYELIGYVGSVLVVVSLAMSSIIRLRIVNLAGALVFSAYGLLIGSFPVVITNGIIAILDVYYLRKELRTRHELTVVSVAEDDPFLEAFTAVFGADMQDFVSPGFSTAGADVYLVMLRDATAAGVFIAVDAGDGTLDVVVDYVAPPYRDHKSGASLYHGRGERFRDAGYTTIRMPSVHEKQTSYVSDMGFVAHNGSASLDVSAT